MNSFQTIVLSIFGLFIIAGLIVVATVKSNSNTPATPVSIWGSIPGEILSQIISDTFDSEKLKVGYKEIASDKFDSDLLEALASGKGPDLVILPAELLLRYRDKIVFVPFANFSDRLFRDSFIQGAEIFLEPTGISALPFSVDPLLMYFNRDMLESESIITPPKFWDEFLSLGSKLTLRDDIGNISQSAVALGEYRNIKNAKEIIATLLLQSGNQIVSREKSGPFRSTLDDSGALAVLDFYTEFANPLKPSYSWNRAQENSASAFLASNLAIYFGFGSEYAEIQRENPNLNFDVAVFPRPRNSSVVITYGKLSGIAVLRTARDRSASLAVASLLTSPRAQAQFLKLSGLPPVRRDLLSQKPTDAFGSILYDSALHAKGFLDPNPTASTPVFQTMIESITSGKAKSGEALSRANAGLRGLIR